MTGQAVSTEPSAARPAIAGARRVVVKVGSSSLTTLPGGLDADRLNRLGVEDALAKAGAVPGDAVTVGDVTFDWEPTLPAGTLSIEETAGLGGRGTDVRLETHTRPRAEDRLAAKKARRLPHELADDDGWIDTRLLEDDADT